MAVTRIEEGGLGTDSFNLPVTLNGTDGSSSNAGDNALLARDDYKNRAERDAAAAL
jgi:hypothetical protein